MTPHQIQVLSTIPYCPGIDPEEQNQQQQPPPQVNGIEWSRDYFEAGTLRYINRIVALQQMAYSYVAFSFSQVPHLADIHEFAAERHVTQIQPQLAADLNYDFDAVIAQENLDGWQVPLASYAAAVVPRPLPLQEVIVDATVVMCVHAADMLRVQQSFHVDL
jgi:hypothetical protein